MPLLYQNVSQVFQETDGKMGLNVQGFYLGEVPVLEEIRRE